MLECECKFDGRKIMWGRIIFDLCCMYEVGEKLISN